MIRIYKNLFFLVYRLLKKSEKNYQSDLHNAIIAVIIISVLETLNVLSFLPANENIDEGSLWVPCIVLLLLNGIVFLPAGRFKKMEREFLRNQPSVFNDSFIVLYIFGTILTFALTR
jgi:hypothetical protein